MNRDNGICRKCQTRESTHRYANDGAYCDTCDPRTVIGQYVLTEPRRYTVGYEVAAWHTIIEVPAGPYPIYATDIAYRPVDDAPYYVTVSVSGVIVDSHTPSLWGGVPIASQRPQGTAHADVGQTMRHGITVGGYALARALMDGTADPAYVLNADWSPCTDTFTYDGEDHHTTSLRRDVRELVAS